MSHWNREFYVSHPLPADLLLSHFDSASVTDDSTVLDSLVLSAMTFIILGRTENLLAEKTVTLRLISPVVDRLRLQDLS